MASASFTGTAAPVTSILWPTCGARLAVEDTIPMDFGPFPSTSVTMYELASVPFFRHPVMLCSLGAACWASAASAKASAHAITKATTLELFIQTSCKMSAGPDGSTSPDHRLLVLVAANGSL